MNLPRFFKDNFITRYYNESNEINKKADKLREKHRNGFRDKWKQGIDKRLTDDYNSYRKRKEREFFDAMTTAYDARLDGKRIRNYKDLARIMQWDNVVPNPALQGYDEAQDEDRRVREEEDRRERELRDRIREEDDNRINTIISNYGFNNPSERPLTEREAQYLISHNLIEQAYLNGYEEAIRNQRTESVTSGGRRTRRRRHKKNNRSRDRRRKRKKTLTTHRHKKKHRSRDSTLKRNKTSRMPRR